VTSAGVRLVTRFDPKDRPRGGLFHWRGAFRVPAPAGRLAPPPRWTFVQFSLKPPQAQAE